MYMLWGITIIYLSCLIISTSSGLDPGESYSLSWIDTVASICLIVKSSKFLLPKKTGDRDSNSEGIRKHRRQCAMKVKNVFSTHLFLLIAC